MANQSVSEFVDERLRNLHEIDEKIVALLEHVSSTVENVKQGEINELKRLSGSRPLVNSSTVEIPRENFRESVQSFYRDLEYMSSRLRREIILMDKKTAFNSIDENDVSLLPISIDKKASWVGDWKFKNQINEIKNLLNNDPNFDTKFEFPEPTDSSIENIKIVETVKVKEETSNVNNVIQPLTNEDEKQENDNMVKTESQDVTVPITTDAKLELDQKNQQKVADIEPSKASGESSEPMDIDSADDADFADIL